MLRVPTTEIVTLQCVHEAPLTERVVEGCFHTGAAATEDLAKDIDVQLSVLPAEDSVHNGVDCCADNSQANSPEEGLSLCCICFCTNSNCIHHQALYKYREMGECISC